MNSNIPTYNRFDNRLHTVKNTQDDAKVDDAIETDVFKARQIPSIESSKIAVKKRPEVVISNYPENQHMFGKENINAKRRHETTLMLYMRILKKILEKLLYSPIVNQAIRKFSQCTDRVAHLKSFSGATSKELAHYFVPILKEEYFHSALIHVGIN